jgi:hypothetical protein
MNGAAEETLVLASLACAFHAGCIVYVGGRAMSPGETDWTDYLQFVERHKTPGGVLRALVLERGFGPTIRQRQTLHAATAGVSVRVAILTNSAFARGVTVMVALVNPGYKAFPLERLQDALAYLAVGRDESAEFEALLRNLEVKVERSRGRPPTSSPY